MLVAEAGEGEPAAPAAPATPAAASPDPAVAGSKARQRSRAKTTDFTAVALAPAVMGAKMRQRSKSTTDFALGEAKQKLADEQKLAAARHDPNWPSRLRLVGAGAAALLQRAYELALSCSAQANGGTADPRDLHTCTWQLPLLLHATRCLRYAELSSWQLRLAWHLALRLSTSASCFPPPLASPDSPAYPAYPASAPSLPLLPHATFLASSLDRSTRTSLSHRRRCPRSSQKTSSLLAGATRRLRPRGIPSDPRRRSQKGAPHQPMPPPPARRSPVERRRRGGSRDCRARHHRQMLQWVTQRSDVGTTCASWRSMARSTC